MAWMMFAAVPLLWTATPERPAPAAFDRHHGETLELRCTLAGFGERPFAPGADVRLWYQTNGMGAAWWSVPATAASNTLAATFTPADDAGADRYALFFGAPSNAYASAVLRLRPSPGFTPNALPPPEQAAFEETDPVFSTWLATADLVHAESDPTVPAWAKAVTPPASGGGLGTNDVRGIIGEWAASEQGEVARAGRAVLADGAFNADYAQYASEAGTAQTAAETQYASTAWHVSGMMTGQTMEGDEVLAMRDTVAAWETYWDGDEVRVTVTNYDSAVHLPSLYIEQKIEGTDDYRTVWDERTRWASNDVQMAALRAAMDEKADRAWGSYDSHTGGYAPDGYTWLSSPRIAIAGGLAYQRTLTTSGAIWVLASNGMVTQTGGVSSNGFFRILDDEGITTLEIVRGNKRTIGATAAGIKVTASGGTATITIPYNVVSTEAPTLYGTTDLTSGEWTQLAATWLGQSGAWTAQVSTAAATFFVKGEYETGGETYIRNVAPVSAEGGIYCTDGVHKVRPVYSNGTITWEVVQ